jgi:glycosyltransferase involved in cell wall biosynthesis
MRILHIHAGKNPKANTSNSYLDSLPIELAKSGNECLLLYCANTSLFNSPKIVQEENLIDSLTVYRIINSSVYAGPPPGSGQGTRTPLKDCIPEERLTTSFNNFIASIKPDICHIQNIFGFPIGLVDILKKYGVPVVFTLHDYTPICPTSHLFLKTGRICSYKVDELECAKCCSGSPSFMQFSMQDAFEKLLCSIRYKSFFWRLVAKVRNTLLEFVKRFHRQLKNKPYRIRLKLMAEFLNKVDLVHCISSIQAKRLQELTGKLKNLVVLPLCPPSLVSICHVPRISLTEEQVPTFCVLNVQNGRDDKGYSFLHEALKSLEKMRSDFKVMWYATGVDTQCVKFKGLYSQDDLDSIASDSDFCIIPSLWYETLAFTGVEMLARGVPLICSKRVGVSEYLIDGVNGLLFEPDHPDTLVSLMSHVLENPEKYLKMRKGESNAPYWKQTFPEHVAEFYDKILLNAVNKAKCKTQKISLNALAN